MQITEQDLNQAAQAIERSGFASAEELKEAKGHIISRLFKPKKKKPAKKPRQAFWCPTVQNGTVTTEHPAELTAFALRLPTDYDAKQLVTREKFPTAALLDGASGSSALNTLGFTWRNTPPEERLARLRQMVERASDSDAADTRALLLAFAENASELSPREQTALAYCDVAWVRYVLAGNEGLANSAVELLLRDECADVMTKMVGSVREFYDYPDFFGIAFNRAKTYQTLDEKVIALEAVLRGMLRDRHKFYRYRMASDLSADRELWTEEERLRVTYHSYYGMLLEQSGFLQIGRDSAYYTIYRNDSYIGYVPILRNAATIADVNPMPEWLDLGEVGGRIAGRRMRFSRDARDDYVHQLPTHLEHHNVPAAWWASERADWAVGGNSSTMWRLMSISPMFPWIW
jgi:hypothetical protein